MSVAKGSLSFARAGKRAGAVVAAIAVACAFAPTDSYGQSSWSWIGAPATGGATTNLLWSSTANWNPASAPDQAGAIVTFSGSWGSGANNVQLAASSTTTVGTVNMTNSGTGTGKLNLGPVSGTAILRLDTGSATQPVFNYTNGSQFDNFVNLSLTGSQGFEKTGGGTIQISGYDSTYTGTTKISAGGVRFARNANLGNPTANINLNGGVLYLRTSNTTALDNRATFASAPGAIKRQVFVTAAATSNIQTESNTLLEITGNITSATGSTLRKSDTGVLTILGENNVLDGVTEFTGGTTNFRGGMTASANVVVQKTGAIPAVLNWTGSGTATGAYFIMNDNGVTGTATLNVSNGTLQAGNGTGTTRFVVGGKGVGTATISGGTVTVMPNSEVSIGSFVQYGGANGNGTVTLSGGLFRATGTGAFFIGYGQSNTTGTFGGRGVLNLNAGGVLETDRLLQTGTLASGTFNFNGGTLRLAGSNANLLSVTTVNVQNGGAVIDTNGFDAGIAQPLANSGSGGLTKNGAGALTLGGANAYVGATAVNAGSLFVNGSLASGSTVTVASGALLGGSGTVGGAVSLLGGGTLSPGAASSVGTLTLNNLLALDGSTQLNYALLASDTTAGGVNNDLVTGVTNLTLAGLLNVAGSGDWTAVAPGASWRLFNYTGTLRGTSLSFGSMPTLTAGYSFAIDTSTSGQVNLTVVPEPSTLALIGIGALVAAWGMTRRRRSGR